MRKINLLVGVVLIMFTVTSCGNKTVNNENKTDDINPTEKIEQAGQEQENNINTYEGSVWSNSKLFDEENAVVYILGESDEFQVNETKGTAVISCAKELDSNSYNILVIPKDCIKDKKAKLEVKNLSALITEDTHIIVKGNSDLKDIEGYTERLPELKECDYLENVNFPCVARVEDYAFSDCISLVSVEVPSATFIGIEAFKGCTSLKDVNLPMVDTMGNRAFEYCTSLVSANIPKVSLIDLETFTDCTSLTTVICQSATYIGNHAFEGCSSLKTIDFSSANTIGNRAFKDCESLENVDFPNVTDIDEFAFANCKALVSVNAPKAKSIGTSSFDNCDALTEIPTTH